MANFLKNEKLCIKKTDCLKTLLFSDQDPKLYVQTILDVHKKYNALVMTAFNNDAGFVAALDKVRTDYEGRIELDFLMQS